jgi:hypothetical protein
MHAAPPTARNQQASEAYPELEDILPPYYLLLQILSDPTSSRLNRLPRSRSSRSVASPESEVRRGPYKCSPQTSEFISRKETPGSWSLPGQTERYAKSKSSSSKSCRTGHAAERSGAGSGNGYPNPQWRARRSTLRRRRFEPTHHRRQTTRSEGVPASGY